MLSEPLKVVCGGNKINTVFIGCGLSCKQPVDNGITVVALFPDVGAGVKVIEQRSVLGFTVGNACNIV